MGTICIIPKRWKAVLVYRGDVGPIVIEQDFDEIEELSFIVEQGPDWNALMSITILLARATDPGKTIKLDELMT